MSTDGQVLRSTQPLSREDGWVVSPGGALAASCRSEAVGTPQRRAGEGRGGLQVRLQPCADQSWIPMGKPLWECLEFDIVIHLPPLLGGRKPGHSGPPGGPGPSGLWFPDESDIQGERRGGDLGMMGAGGRKEGTRGQGLVTWLPCRQKGGVLLGGSEDRAGCRPGSSGERVSLSRGTMGWPSGRPGSRLAGGRSGSVRPEPVLSGLGAAG